MEMLEDRLQEIEDRIRELKERLPAHSTKPAMMMELMALEDERDDILAQMQAHGREPAPVPFRAEMQRCREWAK